MAKDSEDTIPPLADKPWSRPRVLLLACFSITALALWGALFALGLALPANETISRLRIHFSWRSLTDWQALGKCILIYTPTNVLLLTCLSSYIGGCASTVFYVNLLRIYNGVLPPRHANNFYLYEKPFSALLRGFPVYLAFLATAYVASNDPFANTAPESYARVAALTGVLSFAVGYDPRLLKHVLIPFLPSQRKEDSKKDG
jgi:hypothetical protein